MTTTIRSILILCGIFASSADGAIELARDGKSDYVIVLRDRPVAVEQTAARELQEHLKLVTGAELRIVSASDAGERPKITIRKSRDLENDAIAVKTDGRDLHLTGAAPRGVLYAVYTFLEDHVGVRWWTNTESTIPKKPTLSIGDIDFTYQPKLRYRESLHAHVQGENGVAAARMKLNGHFMRIPREYGDHYNIIGWCHTCYELLPPDSYFAAHPEWYGLQDGKRKADHGQMCWTNPEMQKEMAKRALERIGKNPNAGMISISQNDWAGPCECETCKSVDDANGGAHSASLITGINAIAAIIEKEYPDFLIETLAYQYTRKAPTKVKPAKNVLVRLCSIECNFAQPLSSEANKAFGDDLRAWSKLAENLFIWNYVTNFSSYLIPHPNLRPTAADLRFFVDHKVVGVFEQADSPNQLAGDMLPLRCWLQAKLLWNPALDQDQLIREFLDGYYGAAGRHLLEYLNVVNAPAENPSFSRRCYETDVSFLTPNSVAKCVAAFDAAEKAVADDPVVLKRVKRERLALEHVQLLQRKFDGSTSASECREYEDSVKDFTDRAIAAGVVHYSEGRPFPAYASSLQLRYLRWTPVMLPKPGEPLPDGASDIQEDRFQVQRKHGAELVDDAQASNGKAVRMPGSHSNWAVQFHIPSGNESFGDGPWKIFFVLRAQVKSKSGAAFKYGVHEGPTHTYVAIETPPNEVASDGKYRAYGVKVDALKPGMYFWVSPPAHGGVEAVYVDRIFVMKDAK